MTVKLKVKGAEVEAKDAQAAIDAALVEANDGLKSAEVKLAVVEAKLAATEKALEAKDAEIEDLKAKSSEEALDALVEKRREAEVAAVEAEKRKVAVMRAGITVEGRSADAIDGIYELLQKDDGVKSLLGQAPAGNASDSAPAKPKKKPSVSKREAMLARNRGLPTPSK